MKKNKMMRIASVLLIAVMMSTCAISGTFAKYVTSDSATDTARVAKFGVVVEASGSLFSKTYAKDDNLSAFAGSLTVESKAVPQDNVVAPGTKNTDGITFELSGVPEVAVNLAVSVTGIGVGEDITEIFLAEKDNLPNMTTGDTEDTFNNASDYYPVKFTLVQTKDGGSSTLVDAGNLKAVQTALQGLSNDYAAGADLAKVVGTLKLTWAWDFDDSGAGTYDMQDTLLGALAAGTALTPATTLTDGTDYELDMDVKIEIIVTQID